jgi:mannosyltransferase
MPSDSGPPRTWSRGEVIGLGLILVVATLLRFAWLNRHSLWFDEVVMMRLALAPDLPALLELLPRIDAVGAPLYAVILHVWSGLFGPSELAARALGASMSVATVAAACWVGAVAYNRRVGLWCAWLVAVCPLEIQYAQEVRMYAFLGLVTCLCWGCLFSFRRSAPRWKQAAFALGLIVLVYTHSLGGLMVVALAIGYALDRRRSQLRIGSWVLIHLTLAAALTPWIGRYLDHPPNLKPEPRSWSEYVTWLRVFTGGRSTTVIACLVLIVAGLFTRRPGETDAEPVESGGGWRRPGRRFRLDDLPTALVLLAWLVVPPLLLIVYSRLLHPIFGPARYLLFVGPAYLLLLSRSLSKLDVRLSAAVAIVGLVLAGPMINDRAYATVAKPDWRGIARVIREVDAGAPLVLCCDQPHIYYDTVPYYVGADQRIVPVRHHLESLQAGQDGRFSKCWVVTDRLDGIRPTPEVLDRSYKTVRDWHFGRLVLTYRSGSDNETNAATRSVARAERPDVARSTSETRPRR